MKFQLDFRIRVGDEEMVPRAAVLAEPTKYEDTFSSPAAVEGALLVSFDGTTHCGDLFDPILRLADQWIRKLPWVLGGDTETVAYRNSEHCFAFVPEGESVELAFFQGSETEIEEYVLEPTNIRLEAFATESIKMVEGVLAMMKAVSAERFANDDDCKELTRSLDEGRKAWRDYQLRQRR